MHSTALPPSLVFFFPVLSRERVQEEEDHVYLISYIPYNFLNEIFSFSFLSFVQ